MIKFFRHIRRSLINENKMGKYFKYAIGEILLVVIGILIALQINNWNEHRKSLTQERKYVSQLLEDAIADSTFYASRQSSLENQLESYDLLMRYCATPNLENKTDKAIYEERAFPFGSVASESNIMSNIGDYSKINNEHIKEALRTHIINYSYVSKSINFHTEIMVEIGKNMVIKHNLDVLGNKLPISVYKLLCNNEPNIDGTIRYCTAITLNAKAQVERFLTSNNQLIKDCKAYLDD